MFVDLLTSQLFALAFAGLIVLYASTKAFFVYRKGLGTKGGEQWRQELVGEIYYASVPTILVGAYLLITSLFGQFTWPLPGSYNILFYDVLSLGGIVIIAAGLAFYRGITLQLDYVGLAALLVGLMAIFYGYEGFKLGLTQEPLALFLLYLFYGLAGILSFPYMLLVRGVASGQLSRVNPSLNVLVILFWLTLLLGSLLAVFIAGEAVPAHLAHPP
ncbi:hypothetical protein HS1genome_0619 [Sulfodiicoccus acidiphilus]|uniref:DUF981 domain-containing protein n=1 Tax=Sulfodiicoccus acidiphilus TaxID=1670455 RepID=A0A348B228_9CREN|nr:DUF981 family protein [Sulfodiicoccus acidiphilus]BBD72230.1 hypothetical protein HS1genome_0619 [Sulfodiicoccus acidiphilus]GGU05827.1 hypothetical protein GCM10007116_22630 [Sulfodiicoccus acidiphilus]